MSAHSEEHKAVFLDEASEHLSRIEKDLLLLENNSEDEELIGRVFRSLHSIKGGSGFFGLQAITDLSHAMENIMASVRDGHMTMSPESIDILLAGKDKLSCMLEVEDPGQVDCSAERDALKSLLTQVADHSNETVEGIVKCDPVEVFETFNIPSDVVDRAVRQGRYLYRVHVMLRDNLAKKHRAPSEYLQDLDSLGEIVDLHMESDNIQSLADCRQEEVGLHFVFSSVLEPDIISMGLDIPAGQVQLIPLPKEDKAQSRRESPKQKSTGDLEDAPETMPQSRSVDTQRDRAPEIRGADSISRESVRVPLELLDDLVNLTGEMVLSRNRLLSMTDSLGPQVPELPSILQNINLVTSELQGKVMKTRMQPMGNLFNRFNRSIRDISRRLGKPIRFEATGDTVELDKSVMEALVDPLMHIVRNSADHGIEEPDQRRKEGKSSEGVIQLTARQEGGQVQIEVVDDGRGMDPTKLKMAALRSGLISDTEAAHMNDRNALALVFRPGFSTMGGVSEISGRGVGMDVVKTNIERVGGSVDVESQLGRGTRISLRLPLTLAIIPALIVESRYRHFAVPQANLEEITRLDRSRSIERVRGAEVLRIRGKLVPILRLEEVLDIRAQDEMFGDDGPAVVMKDKRYRRRASHFILILRNEYGRFGLLVDSLLDNEEIVAKPLSPYLRSSSCYSGAAILGDGRIVMILDVPGIARAAGMQHMDYESDQLPAAFSLEMQSRMETQRLLLFRNSPDELFMLSLELVSRIEEVDTADIEHIGKREFMTYKDEALPLVRLHDYLPVSKPSQLPSHLPVIIPRLVKHPFGIIATHIDDVKDAQFVLNQSGLKAPGVLGTAIIGGEVGILLDIYRLFEMVEPGEKTDEEEPSLLAGKHILLAEDSYFFQIIVAQYLRDFGCLVDVAVNGRDALHMLEKKKYDLLLTDIEMPVMNGFELAREVRASSEWGDLPIIALTGLAPGLYEMQSRQAGIDRHEYKLNKDHIQQTLESIFSQRGLGLGEVDEAGAADLIDLDDYK